MSLVGHFICHWEWTKNTIVSSTSNIEVEVAAKIKNICVRRLWLCFNFCTLSVKYSLVSSLSGRRWWFPFIHSFIGDIVFVICFHIFCCHLLYFCHLLMIDLSYHLSCLLLSFISCHQAGYRSHLSYSSDLSHPSDTMGPACPIGSHSSDLSSGCQLSCQSNPSSRRPLIQFVTLTLIHRRCHRVLDVS